MVNDKSMATRLLHNSTEKSKARQQPSQDSQPSDMLLWLNYEWGRIKSKFQGAQARIRYILLRNSGAIPQPRKDTP